VVELPREKPEAPLRLFAGVPGLRVVAIGGDGTVAWLLGCLEDLGREHAAARLHWRAPAVGMLLAGHRCALEATLGKAKPYYGQGSKGCARRLARRSPWQQAASRRR